MPGVLIEGNMLRNDSISVYLGVFTLCSSSL